MNNDEKGQAMAVAISGAIDQSFILGLMVGRGKSMRQGRVLRLCEENKAKLDLILGELFVEMGKIKDD